MRKIFFCFFLFSICCFRAIAQSDSIAVKKYSLTSSTTSFALSVVDLFDHYLSPLPYSGIGFRVSNEKNHLFDPAKVFLSDVRRFTMGLGMTVNPTATSSIMNYDFNYGWGVHYHFRPIEHLQLLAGGIADVDFGFKMNARNVNNPVNIDFAMGVYLSVRAIYDIPTYKRTYRLQAELETPFLGFMFVPQLGTSYYEMLMLDGGGDSFHFSSLHNKRGLRQRYFIEVPFRRSTRRFGVAVNLLKYTANDIYFSKNEFTLFYALTTDLFKFTKKKPAPENFIKY
ncbi:DUF3316 domain-containing protein [Paludibacter sp. 221]|uniref:DUF3316 domain-containing protein n=1 Tax=Paludibacter sp. 221 TaxID=2302939 RepID=UPI0013D86ED6|nr:DUF3316 domain-containing protein [Paludibacter sp. 221]NDV45928.1 DUF3316 domain-containing protein [Paludibacter sp. 221]